MERTIRVLRAALVLAFALCGLGAATSRAADIAALVGGLAQGGFDEREKAIEALAATGDPRAANVLEALGAGNLYLRNADRVLVIGQKDGAELALLDAITGEAAGRAPEAALERVRVNNRLRRAVDAAMGSLTLLSPDPKVRRAAAEAVFKSRDPAALPALEKAVAGEKDSAIRDTMRVARAAILLAGEGGEAEQIEAVAAVKARGDQDAIALLRGLQAGKPEAVATAMADAARAIEQTLAFWSVAQNLWYGLSLGSVLLLAAIGLAITFGTMGVINMAHGEMVMLGAYTTFVVQQAIEANAPDLQEASLLIAVPCAFLVAGAVGVGIERGIIRFLYGRPLETLLATFGISLILQQAVRSIFGPTNREVVAPDWMSGTVDIGHLAVTYGRLWIIVFALAIFLLLSAAIHVTPFGLRIRAVTQNRAMAGAMGIRTPWVDALTFGLGSGIAGVAGVALSQIDNVSPNLGQGYIIDSFLVVVFGGVGNLAGTLLGALSLGVLNKILEPYAGAVLGKIVVLVLIVLFIQKRPRGLFAPKGRAAQA